MSNREYWEKRMLALANRQKRKDGEIVSKLTQEYQKLSAGLDRELSAFYGRYAGSEGISMAEAKKLLKGVELENFRLSLEEFREKAVMGGYDQELNEIYLRSRVSRLQALKTQIGLRVRELAIGQRKQLQEHLLETVTDTYYRTVYEVQKGVGVAGNFAQFHTGMLESVLNGVWMAGNFSSRIWANQNKLIGELETVFSQGIVRGDSLEKMTKLWAQRMEVAKNRAATLVETESAHAAAEAAAKGYEETEVEKYDFLATLDLKTCDVCGALDGKTFLVKERETGVNYPPIHPRCHCTTIPHFDSNFTSGTRAARDLETGKTVQIPSMTYEQWREKYVKGNPKAELERLKIKHASADKSQYERYKTMLGKKYMPKSFDDFQELKYNNPEKWEELKTLHREVSWQREAQKIMQQGSVHKIPFTGKPNSVFDNYLDGQLIRRRYYGRTGKPRLDIDMTNHGNPRQHPVVPHQHCWEGQDRSTLKENPLTLGQEIANADILERK